MRQLSHGFETRRVLLDGKLVQSGDLVMVFLRWCPETKKGAESEIRSEWVRREEKRREEKKRKEKRIELELEWWAVAVVVQDIGVR
jgi:hypothetical protein